MKKLIAVIMMMASFMEAAPAAALRWQDIKDLKREVAIKRQPTHTKRAILRIAYAITDFNKGFIAPEIAVICKD